MRALPPHPWTGRRDRGLTLVEMLVAMTVFLFVILATLFLLDFARRSYANSVPRMESQQLARTGMDYLVHSLRQVASGVVTSNPANCLACHRDVDGGMEDNPATDCPLDMVSPDPPISIQTFTVDPANVADITPSNPGNTIEFFADVGFPPTTMNPLTVFEAERRRLYPIVDPNGTEWLLQEEEDHDRDGTPEFTDAVLYGVREVSFTVIRRDPPLWTEGTSVTPSCYGGGAAGCHGTGNPTGPDLYGTGVYTDGSPGEVWAYDHPDDFAVTGVDVRLTAARSGYRHDQTEREYLMTLQHFVRPRGLLP